MRWRPKPGARELADAILAALGGKGDAHAVARQIAASRFQAVFDAQSPVFFGEGLITYLLVKLDAPELAVQRLDAIRPSRPDQVGLLVWASALDPLRCRADFQAMVSKLDAFAYELHTFVSMGQPLGTEASGQGTVRALPSARQATGGPVAA